MRTLLCLHKTEDDKVHGVICPFCERFDPLDFHEDDYVSKPMLWCSGCDARSVLNIPSDSGNLRDYVFYFIK